MKKIIIAAIGFSTFVLGGCTGSQMGTTAGGAAGAGLGYVATGGNAVGSVIGGGAGALLGYNVGHNQDRRAYYNQQNKRAYYNRAHYKKAYYNRHTNTYYYR